MTRQIAETIRRFAIPDDWATWLFVELDRIEAAEADASKGQQRRLREKLAGYDGRLNRLLPAHLDQAVTVEKYRQAKNTLLQDRRKVQETLEEITLRHSSWLDLTLRSRRLYFEPRGAWQLLLQEGFAASPLEVGEERRREILPPETEEDIKRRGRDSNPRYRKRYTGFRNQLDQPLRHLSVWLHRNLLLPATVLRPG